MLLLNLFTGNHFSWEEAIFWEDKDITTGVHKEVSQEVIRFIYNPSSDLFSFRFSDDYILNIKLPVTQNMPPATAKCPKCLILDNMLSGFIF